MMTAVEKLMTRTPRSIRADGPFAEARKLMAETAVDVLPVRHSGELQGVVFAAELDRLEKKRDYDPMRFTIEEAMSGAYIEVGAEEPAEEVARRVVKERMAAAVVKRDELVLGVFSLAQAREVLGIQPPVRKPAPAPAVAKKPEPVAEQAAQKPAAGKPAKKPAAEKAPKKPAAEKAPKKPARKRAAKKPAPKPAARKPARKPAAAKKKAAPARKPARRR